MLTDLKGPKGSNDHKKAIKRLTVEGYLDNLIFIHKNPGVSKRLLSHFDKLSSSCTVKPTGNLLFITKLNSFRNTSVYENC